MELDHLFVCVSPEAMEADLFARCGFTEGTPNIHPGQGTSCRRFFFHNTYVEFLSLDNADDALNACTAPTGLYERLTDTAGAVSPFGLCFRNSAGTDSNECPFPSWSYRPDYLPEPHCVNVAEAPLTEPMWFFLSFAGRPDQLAAGRRQSMNHANGVECLTSVEVQWRDGDDGSEVAAMVSEVPALTLSVQESHLVKLCFDDWRQSTTIDLQPQLPLIVRY